MERGRGGSVRKKGERGEGKGEERRRERRQENTKVKKEREEMRRGV